MQESLFKRLFIYQKERFPLLVHIPLITAFSFSAIGFSRACRQADGFIGLSDFVACLFSNLTLFFLLRVADEYKDREDDALYRTYLPVPRGLISLPELRNLAAVLFLLATMLNIAVYPKLLPLYALMMLYLLLMRYEFFVPAWLKRHQIWYIASHMVIIPLADVYASSYDWKQDGTAAPAGLFLFLLVSYLNGIILEIGRKIKNRDSEETGVVSYTKLWGTKGAAVIWLILLALNYMVARIAAGFAQYGSTTAIVLSLLFVLSAVPALLFLWKPGKSKSKFIEIMSLLWALGMYLSLGGIPTIIKLIGPAH